MLRQISMINLGENYYGILTVPEGEISFKDLREVLRKNTSYAVDEDTIIFIVTFPDSLKDEYLFFPLKVVKKYPFYISILLCVSPVEEVKILCTYEFTESEIGEAKGFFKALTKLVEGSTVSQ